MIKVGSGLVRVNIPRIHFELRCARGLCLVGFEEGVSQSLLHIIIHSLALNFGISSSLYEMKRISDGIFCLPKPEVKLEKCVVLCSVHDRSRDSYAVHYTHFSHHLHCYYLISSSLSPPFSASLFPSSFQSCASSLTHRICLL